MRGIVMVSVVLTLLTTAVGCAGNTQAPSSSGGGGMVPASAAELPTNFPLVGTEWQLAQVVEPSGTWSPPADVDAVLRFDGQGHFSAKACNFFSGAVQLDADVLRFGEVVQTQMGCVGPGRELEEAFVAVVGDQPVRWAVKGRELRLDVPGGHGLRYAAKDGDDVFPNEEATPLLQAQGKDGEYRYAWAHDNNQVGLSWVYRSRPGMRWQYSTMARPADEPVGAPDVFSGVAGEYQFVFGITPLATARVISKPAGGGPAVELELFAIPATRSWLAFGGLVQRASVTGSVVIALDETGRELGRSHQLP